MIEICLEKYVFVADKNLPLPLRAICLRIQKWNCPWRRKRPLFWNFIAWKTFIVFTFAPYILTKLTDFLQTKRDMCLRGLVWAWAAKPSWDLSTGCCCYWAIFDTTVEFPFSSFIDSNLISVSISNFLSYSPHTFTKSQSWTPNFSPNQNKSLQLKYFR